MPLGGDEELSGSHKGYGYGMICEIFSSVLSLGCTSNHNFENGKSGTCHCFAAINPDIFGKREEIEAHLSAFLKELRTSPKADGEDKIYTHGEKEMLAYRDRLKNGIDLNVNTVSEMIAFCNFAGLDSEKYLGKHNIGKKESSYS